MGVGEGLGPGVDDPPQAAHSTTTTDRAVNVISEVIKRAVLSRREAAPVIKSEIVSSHSVERMTRKAAKPSAPRLSTQIAARGQTTYRQAADGRYDHCEA
jgi:hypothetical protein